jgi:hypothetical protein
MVNTTKIIAVSSALALGVGATFAGALNTFPAIFDNKDVNIIYGEDAHRSDMIEAFKFVGTLEDLSGDREMVRIKYISEEKFLGDDYEDEDVKEAVVSKENEKDKLESLKDAGNEILDKEYFDTDFTDIDSINMIEDSEIYSPENCVVVGGPAVNKVAAELLGVQYPTKAFDVKEGEFVIRYFGNENCVLVYGYDKEDTAKALKYLEDHSIEGNYFKSK